MVLLARLNAIFGIAATTAFLCVQQFTKKGIVLKNFSTSLTQSSNTDPNAPGQVPLVRKKTVIDNMKQKYEDTKHKVQQIKEKGNGSYYQGIKKMYKEKDPSLAGNQQPVQKKTFYQILNQKYVLSKQAAKQLKQRGQGSYYQGFKKMYRQYYPPKQTPPADPSTPPTSQSLLTSKLTWFTQLYKKASDAKNQKLVQNHLIFGTVTLAGSLLMPRLYMLWNLGYFVAYQLYYFGETLSRSRGYRSLENIRFVPIWEGFMVGSIVIFGVGLYKIAMALK